MREFFVLFPENLKVFLVELGSKLIYVNSLILHDYAVCLTNNSDQEVHENYKEDNYVEKEENEPNERNN